MLGTLSPPPQVSDPDMHHGACVMHVPWCMPGSLTSGFLWSWGRGKRSRHSRRVRNPQFYVSGKSPMDYRDILGCTAHRHFGRDLTTLFEYEFINWCLNKKAEIFHMAFSNFIFSKESFLFFIQISKRLVSIDNVIFSGTGLAPIRRRISSTHVTWAKHSLFMDVMGMRI